MATKKEKLHPDVAKLRDVPKGTKRSLSIVSSKDGFWRGGIAHTRQAKVTPLGDFTDAQLVAILGEPKLTVEVVDEDEKPAGGKGK